MGGVDSVCGVYANLTHKGVIETEDTATAALRFRCGAVGTIEATCSSHLNWEPTISIHGSEGSIDLRGDQPIKVVFADKAKEKAVKAELAAAVNTPGELFGKSYYGTGHPAQIEDFVSAIREKRKPLIPAALARHTVDVVLGIFQSHRSRKWVKLPQGWTFCAQEFACHGAVFVAPMRKIVFMLCAPCFELKSTPHPHAVAL